MLPTLKIMLHNLTITLKWITDDDLCKKLYDKHYVFTFPMVNFPYISTNITAAPANVVYIS